MQVEKRTGRPTTRAARPLTTRYSACGREDGAVLLGPSEITPRVRIGPSHLPAPHGSRRSRPLTLPVGERRPRRRRTIAEPPSLLEPLAAPPNPRRPDPTLPLRVRLRPADTRPAHRPCGRPVARTVR